MMNLRVWAEFEVYFLQRHFFVTDLIQRFQIGGSETNFVSLPERVFFAYNQELCDVASSVCICFSAISTNS